MTFSKKATDEWRAKYGGEYDDDKFWSLFEWLQKKESGSTHYLANVSDDAVQLLAHLRYYVETVDIHLEFVQIEIQEKKSMFIVK